MPSHPVPASSDEAAPWWAAAALVQASDTTGLGSEQAGQALRTHGPNRIEPHARRALGWELLLRLRNPMLLLLLAAAALAALAGQAGNAALVLAIVALSVGLDFLQEHRAQAAVAQLRESVALLCSVWRDGQARELAVTALVPGDVVLLAAGDRVPADGLVLQARDLFVNQSLLTGESFPVEKRADLPGAAVTELDQATQAVFMGSSVVGGSARMRVVATGADTVLAGIAHGAQAATGRSALEETTQRFGAMIMRVTLLLVLFVVVVNAAWQRPLLESLLFAVALAVGITPELLPMVMSVTLARGALRLARQRVIVKRLAAIHDLGAMDTLCTDKTGTLTQARIELRRCVDGLGRDSARVLELVYLNSVFETGLRSPLDEAVLAHQAVDAAGWTKLDELPFDFERRRVSVLLERAGRRSLVVKGAPDDVLASCRWVDDQGPGAVLDAARLAALRRQCDAFEDQGLRTLAVAWRDVGPDHGHAGLADEAELVFAGFAVFADPPKPDAARALAELAASGVALKIVSGDSERVVQHLCAELGIAVQGVLTGREIAAMDDAALAAQLGKVNLLARVNPLQKKRIVEALRARGHVVGYLGDGINDAPPLRAANVGLSVASAVDAAKEVADIVLQGHDLRVLHQGVLEGRRTVANMLKYMMMATSSNFGNMLSMALAALVLPFLPMLPVQILLNNLLYDLSEAALPMDKVDAEDLRAPRAIDLAFIGRFMAVFGPISSLFDLLTFAVLLWLLRADEALFQTGWFVESLMSQVLVIWVIRTRRRPWASRPARALVLAIAAVLALALALPFITPLAALFHFRPLGAAYYAALALLLPAYLLLVETAKHAFYRRARAAHRRAARRTRSQLLRR